MKHSNLNLLLHSIDKFNELTIFSHLTNLTKPIYLVKLANDSQGNPIVAFVQAQQTVFQGHNQGLGGLVGCQVG